MNFQKLFVFLALICVTHFVACEEQQVKLEDIEHDTLIRETERNTDGSDSKELSSQQTQHIQLSYSNNPQDIFVTPTPSRFNFKGKTRYNFKLPEVTFECFSISRFTSWSPITSLSASKARSWRRRNLHSRSEKDSYATNYRRIPTHSTSSNTTATVHLRSVTTSITRTTAIHSTSQVSLRANWKQQFSSISAIIKLNMINVVAFFAIIYHLHNSFFYVRIHEYEATQLQTHTNCSLFNSSAISANVKRWQIFIWTASESNLLVMVLRVFMRISRFMFTWRVYFDYVSFHKEKNI